MDDELTDLERAKLNIPTPERRAKGDVTVYGKPEHGDIDVFDPAATYPTASARSSRWRISKLYDAGVVSADQREDCRLFWIWWRCATLPYHPKTIVILDPCDRGMTMSAEERVDNSFRYHFVCNPDNGLTADKCLILHNVVCHERRPKDAMQGDDHTKTKRFLDAVSSLQRAIELLPSD